MNGSSHILRFTGTVRCAPGPGAAGVTLLGQLIEPDGGTTPAQLSLLTRQLPQLPRDLQDLSVEASSVAELLLRSGALQWRVPCHTWQLHRDVGASFYGAIPPRPTPWNRRLGWRLLLSVASTAPGRWLLSRRSRAG